MDILVARSLTDAVRSLTARILTLRRHTPPLCIPQTGRMLEQIRRLVEAKTSYTLFAAVPNDRALYDATVQMRNALNAKFGQEILARNTRDRLVAGIAYGLVTPEDLDALIV